MSEAMKAVTNTVNTASGAAIVAAIVGYLPHIAAFVAMLWYFIQIVESKTIQGILENRRVRRSARKLAQLQAQQKVIQAELDAITLKREAAVVAEIKLETAKKQAELLPL